MTVWIRKSVAARPWCTLNQDALDDAKFEERLWAFNGRRFPDEDLASRDSLVETTGNCESLDALGQVTCWSARRRAMWLFGRDEVRNLPVCLLFGLRIAGPHPAIESKNRMS